MPPSPGVSGEGYIETFVKPLEQDDPKSFAFIENLLLNSGNAHPVVFLVETLSNVRISPKEAIFHWKKIIAHKQRLELKLNRPVHIKTAAVDYYDQLGVSIGPALSLAAGEKEQQKPHQAPRSPGADKSDAKPVPAGDPALARIYSCGYLLERLKEEMQRARRYTHALSAMMFDVDLSVIKDSPAAAQIRDRALGIIVKMINKAVRNVDILARHSDNLFLLILPNTNKREALELAERLRRNIGQRTLKIPEFPGAIPLTIAVGQCSPKSEASSEFIKRLENLAASGKQTNPDMVYSLE